MTRGIESAANGMMGVLTLNDVISNNLANINTAGFKTSMVTFKNIQDLAINQKSPYTYESTQVGTLSAGGVVDSTLLDMKQGGLKTTGNPLDLAISGKGFFAVETPDGVAYTRNGSFIKNQEGFLTTINGDPVLGQNGAINLNIPGKGIKDINIDSEGNIFINKNQIDKIKIMDFNNPQNMKSIGNSLLQPQQEDKPQDAKNFQISQGTLEQSNANVVRCMVDSIQGSRTYETLAKVVQTTNSTLGKAVNNVGMMKR